MEQVPVPTFLLLLETLEADQPLGRPALLSKSGLGFPCVRLSLSCRFACRRLLRGAGTLLALTVSFGCPLCSSFR